MRVAILFGSPRTRAHCRSTVILTSRRDAGAFFKVGCLGAVTGGDTTSANNAVSALTTIVRDLSDTCIDLLLDSRI